MTTTTTLDEFIAAHGITMTAEWAESNPNMEPDAWSRDATHYLCTLEVDGRTMAVPYSMGPAHTSEPGAAAVLDSLASDASGVENTPDWLDWAEEFGYEGGADAMRKARATHDTIRVQAIELRALLGDEAYETLLWNTERL